MCARTQAVISHQKVLTNYYKHATEIPYIDAPRSLVQFLQCVNPTAYPTILVGPYIT